MVVPFVIPVFGYGGIMAAKAFRNSVPNDPEAELKSQESRRNGVVDRLIASGTIAMMSEKHLERLIKNNNAVRDRADELRAVRSGSKSKTLSKMEEVAQSPAVAEQYMGA
mmetsp:Transcript_4270/g.9233  ORF Transcript_4270/g.9233 Transcript_4270/m.9233 type:complete len:110 (+) Transcript_4270:160-489(+)